VDNDDILSRYYGESLKESFKFEASELGGDLSGKNDFLFEQNNDK
jgi:hypothetical protein